MENGKKRIAVKVGTSTLTHPSGELNLRNMDKLAQVLSDMKHAGCEIILVSSGAIAVGVNKLSMENRPEELRLKQAAAAVGQCELMHLYDKFFSEYGVTVGQILLTKEDVERPSVRKNLMNTFCSLLELGVLPIVNENDSVSFEEIESDRKIFGDNDTLSAIVADLCQAELLVLLSDIDGLHETDPKTDPNSRLIREIRVVDDEIRNLAGGAGSARGTGGMITKLAAAQLCMNSGIDMVITNGAEPQKLYSILDNTPFGTLFVSKRKNTNTGGAFYDKD